MLGAVVRRGLWRGVGTGLGRRRLAMETKKPFVGPPSPPTSAGNDGARLLIAGGGMALIIYVFMLPENDYDMLNISRVHAPPPCQVAEGAESSPSPPTTTTK